MIIVSNTAWAAPIDATTKAYARKAFQYVKKNQFDKAERSVTNSNNTHLKKLITWLKIQDNDYRPSQEELADWHRFIVAHKDWPQFDRMYRRLEGHLSIDTPGEEISSYFKGHAPQTSKGKWLYALALQEKQSEDSSPERDLQITKLAREVWTTGSLNADDETLFLKQFQKRLQPKDYVVRIDRLIWKEQVTAAKRNLPRVSKSYQKLFLARIALYRGRGGIDKKIAAIPKNLKNDPGLQYQRARWREKRKQIDGVLEIVKKVSGIQEHNDKWWKLRHRLIRELLKNKRYNDAYHIAQNHGSESGSYQFAEAEWLAGWISLRFLNNPRTAYEHFYAMYVPVKFPISKARGAYWAGRAAEANNNPKIAKKWYRLAAENPTSFYGQLAIEKMGFETPGNLLTKPVITKADRQHFAKNGLVQNAYLLFAFDFKREAKRFLSAAVSKTATPGEAYLLQQMGHVMNIPYFSVYLGKEVEQQRQEFNIAASYPIPEDLPYGYTKKSNILSIIRQESRFDPSAQSPVGARGLMQLMPRTARLESKRLKLRYHQSKLIKDPAYNVKLGSYHLSKLIKNYDGHITLAAAAYNAGGGNTNRWLRDYGDPRTMQDIESIIDWIELIPFGETRNYVQRIVENVQVYQLLLEQKPFNIKDMLRPETQMAAQ